MRECYKREWFESVVYLEFEDRKFPVPGGYKEFLIQRYGNDFMELPPKKDQGIKLNDIVAWDANIPYREYESSHIVNRKE